MRQIQYSSTASHYLNERYFNLSDLALSDTHVFILNEYFIELGPKPAFGRLGLGGSSGECSSHGYTFRASLRAYSTQLGGDRLSSRRLSKDGEVVLDG